MIDVAKLTTDIQAIFETEKVVTTNQENSIQYISSELAKAVADAIQRGIQTSTINFNLTAGTTPVTGTINLTITE